MNFFLKYLSGPVIGAVIGYFTNYIAVKMLFHPYKPVYIGKWKLPFTPGIMPKRKSALAKAVGNAVGKNLFTSEDLKALLMSNDTTDKIIDGIIKKITNTDTAFDDSDELETLNTAIAKFMDEDEFVKTKESLSDFLSVQLIAILQRVDIGSVIKEQSAEIFNQAQDSLGMFAMFLKGNMLDMVLSELAQKLNTYIAEHGQEKVSPAIHAQVEELANWPLYELSGKIDEDVLRKVLKVAYSGIVSAFIESVTGNIDIASVVEEKVNAMSVKDVESLCMSVMKNELDAVVNLGAVIGFVIGILNVLICKL